MKQDEPDEWEHIMPMAQRLARRDAFDPVHRADEAFVLRRLMEAIGAPATCTRPRCRRAAKCLTPKIDCLWLALPFLRAEVFPFVQALAQERLATREAAAGEASDDGAGEGVAVRSSRDKRQQMPARH